MILPGEEAQQRVNRIIYDELVRATVTARSRREVSACVESLAAEGAEGVVLACTELPFLFAQDDSEVATRLFDTTEIHAHKALLLAMGAKE